MICLASLLWSLWLARNECAFNKVKISQHNLHFIIKHRTYAWSVATNLVQENQENIWECHPLQTFRVCRSDTKRAILNSTFAISDFLCFSDGSWKDFQNNGAKAGIGGYILNKDNRVISIFSGPSIKESVFDTECEALLFIIDNIRRSSYRNAKFIFLVDSLQIVQEISKIKGGKCFLLKNNPIDTFMAYNNNFIHIPRELNSAADSLAKQGKSRNKMYSGWMITRSQ